MVDLNQLSPLRAPYDGFTQNRAADMREEADNVQLHGLPNPLFINVSCRLQADFACRAADQDAYCRDDLAAFADDFTSVLLGARDDDGTSIVPMDNLSGDLIW